MASRSSLTPKGARIFVHSLCRGKLPRQLASGLPASKPPRTMRRRGACSAIAARHSTLRKAGEGWDRRSAAQLARRGGGGAARRVSHIRPAAGGNGAPARRPDAEGRLPPFRLGGSPGREGSADDHAAQPRVPPGPGAAASGDGGRGRPVNGAFSADSRGLGTRPSHAASPRDA